MFPLFGSNDKLVDGGSATNAMKDQIGFIHAESSFDRVQLSIRRVVPKCGDAQLGGLVDVFHICQRVGVNEGNIIYNIHGLDLLNHGKQYVGIVFS